MYAICYMHDHMSRYSTVSCSNMSFSARALMALPCPGPLLAAPEPPAHRQTRGDQSASRSAAACSTSGAAGSAIAPPPSHRSRGRHPHTRRRRRPSTAASGPTIRNKRSQFGILRGLHVLVRILCCTGRCPGATKERFSQKFGRGSTLVSFDGCTHAAPGCAPVKTRDQQVKGFSREAFLKPCRSRAHVSARV